MSRLLGSLRAYRVKTSISALLRLLFALAMRGELQQAALESVCGSSESTQTKQAIYRYCLRVYLERSFGSYDLLCLGNACRD